MVGKLKRISLNPDGTQNLTITIMEDFREAFDSMKDGEVKIEIRKYSRRRSLEANSYCWMLIDKIAEKTGYKKSEVYRNAIRDIGGVSMQAEMKADAVPAFRQSWEKQGLGNQVEIESMGDEEGSAIVRIYFGSSLYDKAQMGRLIDSVVQDAQAQGISTISTAEQERLIEAWGKKHG